LRKPIFTIVNVAALVLRGDAVDHEHFRAPPIFPVLGALISVALIVHTATDDPTTFARAGGLIVLGALLYLLNRTLSR
jgi:hypothetical protein